MRSSVIFLALLLLGGCAIWGGEERKAAFETTSRAYERAMEWSNYEALGSFVRLPDGSTPFNPATLKDFKVTSYKSRIGSGSADGGTVIRQATISYVWLPRMSERTTSVQEVWEYSEKDKRWFLKSGIPEFR